MDLGFFFPSQSITKGKCVYFFQVCLNHSRPPAGEVVWRKRVRKRRAVLGAGRPRFESLLHSISPTHEPSRCEFSKMRTCVPSVSGVSEMATCPSSPIAADLQLCHLSPPPPPPVTNSSPLLVQRQSLYASCCTVPPSFSRYCRVRFKMFSQKKKKMFSLLLCLFSCIICVRTM